MMDLPPSGGDGAVIDAYAVRSIAAFINFSCDPNLKKRPLQARPTLEARSPVHHCSHRLVRSQPSLGPKRVGFFATRDIRPGESLGYRRDDNAWSRRKRSQIPCACGAKQCSGFL